MAERCFFLDRSPGEVRGVVVLDGAPERLLLEREGDESPRLGAIYGGRVTEASARLNLARIDLGNGQVGSLRLRGLATPPHEGQRLNVTVVAEPAGGKPAALRLAEAQDDRQPGLLSPAPSVEARLRSLAGTAPIVEGELAREQADEAESAVLARRSLVEGGLALTVEPTQALTAVDVDLEESGAALSVSQANLRALWHAARLLRLKALAGLIVIDLIGFPKDRRRLLTAAAEAFAPDGPETVIGALGQFGALELAKPHLEQPLVERLLDPDGRPSARTVALDLVRRLERQGRFEPGRRLEAVCAPDVATLLRPLVLRLGPRFGVREAAGTGRQDTDIVFL
ncbi:MAG: ribonuclease E/G [Caulobacteraceae bacterium]